MTTAQVKRLPWMKLFTRDWRGDPPLRMCSYAARGLWADLLTLMFESREVGFLLVEGVSPTVDQLVCLLGGNRREMTKWIEELATANIFSRTGDDMPSDVAALVPSGMPKGVMLSRRMVRDGAQAVVNRENGKTGGNPKLTGRDNGGDNPQANPQRSEAEAEAEKKEHLVALATANTPSSPTEQEAFDLFCAAAKRVKWATPRQLDEPRRRKLQAILKLHGPAVWVEMLAAAEVSDFLTRQWKMTFDWCVKPANFLKIIEGNYAGRPAAPTSGARRDFN